MRIESSKLTPKAIRKAYPDCPQREMALGLLREGKLAQAESWLRTLDRLIRNGQEDLDDEAAVAGKNSA